MNAARSTAPPADDHDDDEGFAATVAEEYFTGDGADAPAAERDIHSLPTIGHVGRYALKHLLGAGGLGTVYAALDPLLSRSIAVKTLRLGEVPAAQRQVFEAQLLAEARAAAGLNHPHIVTVHDAGLAEEGVYIAMERLKGKDLRELLADGWRPDAVQAARIAKRVAEALAYAHGRGVVHCDIKPANIFMTGRTTPKVLDFGIARVAQQGAFEPAGVDVSTGATVPPPDLGSPYYVSPEHLRGEPLDARCDVYGLGLVLYELLAGRRAIAGDDLDAIRRAILEQPVPGLREIDPAIDEALAAIVARAMARDPRERWRSALHLANALRQWISDETNGVPHGASARREHRAQGWVWASGATLAGVFGVAAWLFAVYGGKDQDAASALLPQPQPAARAAPAAAAPERTATATAPFAPVAPAATLTAAPRNTAAANADKRSVEAKRADDARARERRAAVAREAAPAAPAVVAQGVVQLAVSPWGQVEVDGQSAGTTPPLTRLTLPEGTHRIVIRNDEFPPFTATVTVTDDKPVTLRHRFGS